MAKRKRTSKKKTAALVWLFYFTFVAISNLAAISPGLDELSLSDREIAETAIPIFERARRSIWSGPEGSDLGLAMLSRAETQFSALENPAIRSYFLAQVELSRGRALLDSGPKSRAREHFERSMELAEESISERPDSDAYRVLADAGASWMTTKGLGGIISMAPKVQEWSDMALQLDPDNALAIIISAQGQINAPSSAGGDPVAALERLQNLLERDDLDDIEEFWAWVSLSQAFRKNRLREDSRAACSSAALIFPANPILERCR